MLHIYTSVSGVFIRTLQVLSFGCCNVLQWLHTCFQVFFLCFASVSNSDVCCKYFSYFGRMLQGFYLDVSHVERDPLAAAAYYSCWGTAKRAPMCGRSVQALWTPSGRAKQAGAGNWVQGNRPAGVGVRTRVRVWTSRHWHFRQRISNLTKFIEKYKNLYFQVYLL
jgi:hypothetical protein